MEAHLARCIPMKVSILIPAFNAADTLRATLLSCIEQGAAIVDEIIVVDDHSDDDTRQTFEEVQEQHPHFHWVWATSPRKGACSARNHALQLSSGDWIQWLDADDLLGPGKIDAQLRALEESGHGLATCPFRPFKDNPITGRIEDPRDWELPSNIPPADWIAKDPMCIPACWLGSRELMMAAGPWDESLAVNQDGEYFCRVIAACDGVIFQDDIEVHYRREGGGVSAFSETKADSLYRSIQSMEQTALQLETSERMQQMISNRYQAFIYTAYPARPNLIREAELKLRELPRPTISNPNAASQLSRLISQTLGWKTLTRMRLLKQSIQA